MCGGLAVELAKNGAKHIAAISRSGFEDENSQFILQKIRWLRCHVDLFRGDITVLDDVKRVFSQTAVPIGGIIHGAMVLLVSSYSVCPATKRWLWLTSYRIALFLP